MKHLLCVTLFAATGLAATNTPTAETCPGDNVDLSGLTPCFSGTIAVAGTTTGSSDDIDEAPR